MAAYTKSTLPLPDDAKAVIWRIFGAGESPLTNKSAFDLDLIEQIIVKYVTDFGERNCAISEIRSWFESIGQRQWLKSDMREPVAILILDGIGTERSDTAIWAIGSISSDLATNIIRSRWCAEEIDSFVETTLTILEKICTRNEILSAAGITPYVEFESYKANIPRDAVQREGRLETFWHLDAHGFDLIHRALHPPVGNLIELVINLRPDLFESLIERLDHPVMQLRATFHMISTTRGSDLCKLLLWIAEESCDALIALAIIHTLKAINQLDETAQPVNHFNEDRCRWSKELRPPQDDRAATAVALLTGLVDRLNLLNPLACARWLGELLSGAPYMLMQGGDIGKPLRFKQLENVTTELFAHLVGQFWSEELLTEFRAGLRLTPRTTWTRHLAAVAWAVREVEPTHAATIARVTLDEHECHVAEELQRGHLFLDWNNWHDREWVSGLAKALVLSCDELDLPKWISTRCEQLPLSVWDAEKNYQLFSAADRAARIWFLVALHAVEYQKQIGRAVDSRVVRTVAETVWIHCHFAGQYLHGQPEASVAAEHAARSAVEFGEPSDLWLLKQARNPRNGSRALWALIDQRIQKIAREGGSDVSYHETNTNAIVRAAAERFGDGGQFDFESLYYWGRLWLLLGAFDQAEQTAKAIIAFPIQDFDRVSEILVLKLLILAAGNGKMDPGTWDYIESTYQRLWPGFTIGEERLDRQEIDEMLERLSLAIQ